MKKFIVCFALLLIAQTGFAQDMVLDNATSYPLKNKKSKIAIQWAASAQGMQAEDKAIVYGQNLNTKSLQILNQSGKIKVNIPYGSEYFRIVVWSEGEKKPDLLSSWVNIVLNKNYTIHQDQLIPAVLMSGVGC